MTSITMTRGLTLALALGVTLAVASSPALAGNLADPIVAPEVVADAAVESSSDEWQGMIALLAVALILTGAMGI
ncbi:MAG: hypothetical protein WAO78_04440 [Roseovarius sp.]